MKDKVFLDTNVLIYCYAVSEPVKQNKALAVSNLPNAVISTQVQKEFVNILRKKFNLDWSAVRSALDEVEANLIVQTNTTSSIKKACDVAERYGFSFYDSLIVAAALECSCTKLYSEDMQHGQVIEKVLTIVNPFL